MKFKLSKNQWEQIGKTAGWMKKAQFGTWHDCPKCGKPQSATDDRFCGECEGKYQQETHDNKQAEIARLRQEFSNCPCRKLHEEGCQKCTRILAEIYELEGNQSRADMLMNQ